MSGSPKYAEIQMREAEERRLVEGRRRRAEEERRRREEAERLAQIALVAQLRGTLNQEAAQLRAAVSALRSETEASGCPFTIHHIEAEIEAVRRAVDSPEALSASLGKLRVMAGSVASLRGQVARSAAALASEQDDIRREADAEARRLMQVEQSKEADRQRQALLASTGLQARLEGIRADGVAMAWSSAEVEAVGAALVDIERSPDPSGRARGLHSRLDAALEHAQVRQLAEERRAYIVASLQDGLRQQGFQVGDAALVGVGEGEVAFRASRVDRRWVEVNVPLQGHVFYDVDGTDRITEGGSDGLVYTGCDEAEARLEALHAELAQRFGIQAGELFWESKDPLRERRNANSLPSGGPSATRKKG